VRAIVVLRDVDQAQLRARRASPERSARAAATTVLRYDQIADPAPDPSPLRVGQRGSALSCSVVDATE
jgi:hypothetical protein